MSIENLKADLKANLTNLPSELSSLSTTGDIVNHLKNTFWPFVENVVEEMGEIDAAVAELYENSDDILTYETGKLFMGFAVGAKLLVDELKAVTKDPAKLKAIAEWEALGKQVVQAIEEITLPEDPDGDLIDGDDEDPDDDEDDDDEDDKEPARG